MTDQSSGAGSMIEDREAMLSRTPGTASHRSAEERFAKADDKLTTARAALPAHPAGGSE